VTLSAGPREAVVPALIQIVVRATGAHLYVPMHRWRWERRVTGALLAATLGWLAATQLAQFDEAGGAVALALGRPPVDAGEAERLRLTLRRELARIASIEAAAASRSGVIDDASLSDDDLVDILGRLATEAMLRVDRVESGVLEGEGDWTQRSMRIVVGGSYFGVEHWVRRLGFADRPIGIDALRIEREKSGSGVRVRADLKVLGMHAAANGVRESGDRLPQGASGSAGQEIAVDDPFISDAMLTRRIVGRLSGAGRVIEVALGAQTPVPARVVIEEPPQARTNDETVHPSPADREEGDKEGINKEASNKEASNKEASDAPPGGQGVAEEYVP
jgi:hypothetical protein